MICEVAMDNEERIYKLCDCIIDLIDELPYTQHMDWVRDRVVSIMADVENTKEVTV